MKNLVSKFDYKYLRDNLIYKHVNFKSDCEFFPNFDLTGYVYDIVVKNNEYLFLVKHKNGKNYTIGSHMKNLSFEIIM